MNLQGRVYNTQNFTDFDQKYLFVCFNGIAAEWPLRIGKSWSEDSLIRGVLTTSCQNQTLLIIHLDLILT